MKGDETTQVARNEKIIRLDPRTHNCRHPLITADDLAPERLGPPTWRRSSSPIRPHPPFRELVPIRRDRIVQKAFRKHLPLHRRSNPLPPPRFLSRINGCLQFCSHLPASSQESMGVRNFLFFWGKPLGGSPKRARNYERR